MFETATSKAFICSITLVHIFQTTHNHFSIFRTPIRAVSHLVTNMNIVKKKDAKPATGDVPYEKIFLKFF